MSSAALAAKTPESVEGGTGAQAWIGRLNHVGICRGVGHCPATSSRNLTEIPQSTSALALTCCFLSARLTPRLNMHDDMTTGDRRNNARRLFDPVHVLADEISAREYGYSCAYLAT